MSYLAKLVLWAVRDLVDAFGLLKSVAGGLCFILENCKVGKVEEFLNITENMAQLGGFGLLLR